MTKHTNPAALIDMAVSQMGSVQALAAALQINRTTVMRWHRGQSGLSGTALVALMALIRHPEDFERYKQD
jgi:DNA-binding transcriptional regulator YiaG